MVNTLVKIAFSLALLVLFHFASQPLAFTQSPQRQPGQRGQRLGGPPDPAHHAGGQVVSISGSTITVKNREGEEQTITVNDKTTYAYNREDATLASFKAGNFLMAVGSRDASGQFIAESVMGGDQPPPRGFGGRRPGFGGIGGQVTAIDASAGTITVKNFRRPDDSAAETTTTIYVNTQTTYHRNRADATLADFKVGDFLRAEGALNDSKQFVATGIFGGDQQPNRRMERNR
jgi:hypothetical protein